MARASQGRSRREKGKRWEREVRSDLEQVFGVGVVRRRPQSDNGLAKAVKGGDVEAGDPPRLVVECKQGYGIPLEAALRQLDEMRESRPQALPIVAVKTQMEGRKAREIAIVPWEWFLALVHVAGAVFAKPGCNVRHLPSAPFALKDVPDATEDVE